MHTNVEEHTANPAWMLANRHRPLAPGQCQLSLGGRQRLHREVAAQGIKGQETKAGHRGTRVMQVTRSAATIWSKTMASTRHGAFRMSAIHGTAGLLGVLGLNTSAPTFSGRIGMAMPGTAFDGTAELAARHDLLAGIAAFLETHAIDRLVDLSICGTKASTRVRSAWPRRCAPRPRPTVRGREGCQPWRGFATGATHSARGWPAAGEQVHHACRAKSALSPHRLCATSY